MCCSLCPLCSTHGASVLPAQHRPCCTREHRQGRCEQSCSLLHLPTKPRPALESLSVTIPAPPSLHKLAPLPGAVADAAAWPPAPSLGETVPCAAAGSAPSLSQWALWSRQCRFWPRISLNCGNQPCQSLQALVGEHKMVWTSCAPWVQALPLSMRDLGTKELWSSLTPSH